MGKSYRLKEINENNSLVICTESFYLVTSKNYMEFKCTVECVFEPHVPESKNKIALRIFKIAYSASWEKDDGVE
jgi:hypothetical protein